MTKERQALIDRFQKWLDTKPREQIIAAQCATIAEEYAEQLRLNDVINRRELLIAFFDSVDDGDIDKQRNAQGWEVVDNYLKAIDCC